MSSEASFKTCKDFVSFGQSQLLQEDVSQFYIVPLLGCLFRNGIVYDCFNCSRHCCCCCFFILFVVVVVVVFKDKSLILCQDTISTLRPGKWVNM